jgi:hypothetical protein
VYEMTKSEDRLVKFIQCDTPPLKSGKYAITVKEVVNQQQPNEFSATMKFAVTGVRFAINTEDINCPFPPDLANGEYSGTLPHIVLNRRTLPWERASIASTEAVPWLAVLLFNDDECALAQKGLTADDKKVVIQKLTAKALAENGSDITVDGSAVTPKGELPKNYLSYPGINHLECGESPDDPCTVIDIPLELFNRVAPAAEDMQYTAQIREVDTTNTVDHTDSIIQYAIVMGNRVAKDNAKSQVFLVSLEKMGDYLPGSDGTASPHIPAGTTHLRLITYYHWSFTANTMGETFNGLASNLNKGSDGTQGLTSLQYPFNGNPPARERVETAISHQAKGTLTSEDAEVLVNNAFSMGYIPLNHHLRHAGQTVSWYRGPLVPYPVAMSISIPFSCPDAANQYNPQAGMFDVSYGAAWQLGQLLALQNTGFSTSLYIWKRNTHKAEFITKEQELIRHRLQDKSANGRSVFQSLFSIRAANGLQASTAQHTDAQSWTAKLMLLNGVPFQYLVPDESMLPPESLRLFFIDPNWIAALTDGAFSIGRFTTEELKQDARHLPILREAASRATKSLRQNPVPLTAHKNDGGRISGFLLRSQLVSGWPGLNIKGYSDSSGDLEIPILRMSRLSDEILICIFDGAVKVVAICEPSEQLHSGIEVILGQYKTTLRDVTGPTPGRQFLTGDPYAIVPSRQDGSSSQTLMIGKAADDIVKKLNSDFGQGIKTFTSAEFALEMVKGSVEVEFQQG